MKKQGFDFKTRLNLRENHGQIDELLTNSRLKWPLLRM